MQPSVDLEHIMDDSTVRLSAIIIAKNEEKRIRAAIQSVRFADEILLIDNGSIDKTVHIARQAKARVISAPHATFGQLRSIGRDQASGNWIVYVDADEVVPQELATEIADIAIQTFTPDEISSKNVCFFIKRKNIYMGTPWPVQDKMQRLFYRHALTGWKGELHETPIVTGKTSELVHSLDHNTHRTLEEMLEKTNVWSHTEALLRLRSSHPPVVTWRLVRVFLTGFWQTYIREGGWRAGTVGMIESMYQGFSLFITYAKLWELQQKRS
jgi:glycosyltransferase involved in cell wall biosynthesis